MTVHNQENPSTTRTKLAKQVVVAFRNIVKQNSMNNDVKDSIAYISFLLKDIQRNVDSTACAWEKRDYWVKADKFRREWQWVDKTLAVIHLICEENQWDEFPSFIMIISNGLQNLKIKLSKKDQSTKNWQGAYNALVSKQKFVY